MAPISLHEACQGLQKNKNDDFLELVHENCPSHVALSGPFSLPRMGHWWFDEIFVCFFIIYSLVSDKKIFIDF